jgi:hypothetical protein
MTPPGHHRLEGAAQAKGRSRGIRHGGATPRSLRGRPGSSMLVIAQDNGGIIVT